MYCKVLFKVKLTGVKPVATVVPACFNIIEKPVMVLPTMSCVVTVNLDVVVVVTVNCAEAELDDASVALTV